MENGEARQIGFPSDAPILLCPLRECGGEPSLVFPVADDHRRIGPERHEGGEIPGKSFQRFAGLAVP
jgi:hypothetical protein